MTNPGLGSTMALTDAEGDVVNTYDYDVSGSEKRFGTRSGRMPKLTPLRVIGATAAAGILVLVAAGLVLAALFAWCSPHFDRSDLVGVYVAKYPSGTETITLKPDGTFLQEVTLKEPQDSTPVTRVGSWEWDESAQTLRLHDGMAVNDGFGDISPTFRTDSGGAYGVDRRWWFFGQILLGDQGSAPLWKVD